MPTQTITSAPPAIIVNLMTLTCEDKKAEVRLTAYADTIVRNKHDRIVAIRFGGYPEHVRAMTECICAGCSLKVDTGKEVINGNTATMEIKGRARNPQLKGVEDNFTGIINFKKEGNSWKIVSEDIKYATPKNKLLKTY